MKTKRTVRMLAFLIGMSVFMTVKGEKMVDKNELLKNLIALQEEDQRNDKKGVFWDGETVSIHDDEMDDETIVTDRFGMTNIGEIRTEDWTMSAKIQEDVTIVEQSGSKLCYEGDDWRMTVRSIDYHSTREEYLEREGYMDLSEKSLSTVLRERYKESSLFVGFEESGEKVLAGYTFLLQDYFGHEYEISYYGTGFLEDIYLNASCMAGTFLVDFDMDAWAEEHRPDK